MADRRSTTTQWTVVLVAREATSRNAAAALEHLCRTYWAALYAYARHRGRSAADAGDLTQAFFARFLEKRFSSGVKRRQEKCRSYFLKAFNHFLADEWRRVDARNRAGTFQVISISTDEWESRYERDPASDATPEDFFERRWARALFDHALARLRHEVEQAGKYREFDLLKEFISPRREVRAYAAAARNLGLSEAAVAVHVHRFRKRYGQLVRDEVARTVGNADEVEEELSHLLDILGE